CPIQAYSAGADLGSDRAPAAPRAAARLDIGMGGGKRQHRGAGGRNLYLGGCPPGALSRGPPAGGELEGIEGGDSALPGQEPCAPSILTSCSGCCFGTSRGRLQRRCALSRRRHGF